MHSPRAASAGPSAAPRSPRQRPDPYHMVYLDLKSLKSNHKQPDSPKAGTKAVTPGRDRGRSVSPSARSVASTARTARSYARSAAPTGRSTTPNPGVGMRFTAPRMAFDVKKDQATYMLPLNVVGMQHDVKNAPNRGAMMKSSTPRLTDPAVHSSCTYELDLKIPGMVDRMQQTHLNGGVMMRYHPKSGSILNKDPTCVFKPLRSSRFHAHMRPRASSTNASMMSNASGLSGMSGRTRVVSVDGPRPPVANAPAVVADLIGRFHEAGEGMSISKLSAYPEDHQQKLLKSFGYNESARRDIVAYVKARAEQLGGRY